MQASAKHILVKTEDEAKSLIDKIEQGESFENLAENHSLCPSGKQGGDLGTFGQGAMVPEFDKVVFSGEVGKTLGPVKTQFGYHLIKITNRG